MIKKYIPEISKLSKANSTLVGGRIVYIVKKDYEGKPSNLYIAYDYKTKVQLTFGETKELLIEQLEKIADKLKEIQ